MTLSASVPELLAAVRRNDLDGVRRELELGASPDAEKGLGIFPETAVELAALRNDVGLDVLSLLLEKSGRWIDRSLAYAARNGRLDKVELLLASGRHADDVDEKGYSALLQTAGDVALIDRLAEAEAPLSMPTKYGETLVGTLLWSGSREAVRHVVALGGAPFSLGWTALHSAVVMDDGDGIRRHAGDRLREVASCGTWTPGSVAVAMDHAHLLDLVDDPNEWMETALRADARDSLAELLRRGASVSDAPIWFVRSVETFDLLVAAGADPARCDEFGSNGLVGDVSLEVLERFVAAGLELDRADGCGDTPLLAQIGFERRGNVAHLLAAGADPNSEAGRDLPLALAVRMDNEPIVRMLLAAGAEADFEDWEGWSPIQGAKSVAMARLLLDAGARPSDAIRRQLIADFPRMAEVF